MTTQELLIAEAIKQRKPIEYEYNKPGKVNGKRIGNPHILFAGVTSEGTPRTWVHIAQTGGVSDTLTVFPDWRMFISEFIANVRILEDEAEFPIQPGYNPMWPTYLESQILAKL